MKVAIVGAEEHTRHLAPWNDPDYEIWVFNEWANADWCKRWDVCFQLHKPEIYRNLNNDKDPHHWEWLQTKHNKPIYMQKVDEAVPDSVLYPLDEINREFMSTLTYQGMRQKNFRATLCYALALAIYKDDVDSIDIWGVELNATAEYKSQQTNFAFWVGVATGLKIPINLHCCDGMFNKPLYAYEEFMEEEELQNYITGLSQQLEEAKQQAYRLEGALALAQQMLTDRKAKQDVTQTAPQTKP